MLMDEGAAVPRHLTPVAVECGRCRCCSPGLPPESADKDCEDWLNCSFDIAVVVMGVVEVMLKMIMGDKIHLLSSLLTQAQCRG